MELRKEKHIEDIMDFISEKFDLTIPEEEVIESVIGTLQQRDINTLKQIEHLLNDEIENLLNTLDSYDIRRYAERNLDMVDECEECDCEEKEIGDFDIDVMIEHIEESGYTVLEYGEVTDDYDLVDNYLFAEISTVFDSLNCNDRERLRNIVVNFR